VTDSLFIKFDKKSVAMLAQAKTPYEFIFDVWTVYEAHEAFALAALFPIHTFKIVDNFSLIKDIQADDVGHVAHAMFDDGGETILGVKVLYSPVVSQLLHGWSGGLFKTIWPLKNIKVIKID
jgi:hypothetical protein